VEDWLCKTSILETLESELPILKRQTRDDKSVASNNTQTNGQNQPARVTAQKHTCNHRILAFQACNFQRMNLAAAL